MRFSVTSLALVLCASTALALNSADIPTANGYDDAWESDWATSMKNVNDAHTGMAGLVVHVGDSITYSNPYSQWSRVNPLTAGQTAEDLAVVTYCGVNSDPWPDDPNDGNWLAREDVPSANGSYTAETGMSAEEYLNGPRIGLPSCDQMFVTGSVGATYDGKSNLVGARAAEVCFLMLGTNDVSDGISASDFKDDMIQIITKMMQNNNTIVCLSTIPPHINNEQLGKDYNTEIRKIAKDGLVIAGVNGGARVYFPLIDYYEAIVYRRPSDWNGTLLQTGDVHPTWVGAADDPYTNSGENLSDCGYLLRSWLWVQKFKEVHDYCILGNLPTPSAPVASAGTDQNNVPALTTITLDGSASLNASTYEWTWAADSDATPTITGADTDSPSFDADAPGLEYHLVLTVTDGGSQTDVDDVWVRVDSTYTVADITGALTVGPDVTVTLNANASWTWNGSYGYTWTVTPLPADLTGQGTATITFTSTAIGDTFAVTLTVDDTAAHTAVDNVTVTVIDPTAGGAGSSGVSCSPKTYTSSGIFPTALILLVTAGLWRRRRRALPLFTGTGERITRCREHGHFWEGFSA